MKKYTVEFIGTFFLMITIIAAVANAGNLAALAIGSVLMVMVYAGGPISGGHFNPSVTLGAWLSGNFKSGDLIGYFVAQIGGGLLAAVVANYGLGLPVGSGMHLEATPALTAEFLGTFALVMVVLTTAVSSRAEGNSYFGLAIGFTVGAMAFAFGSISGGAFNPAVAFGGSLAGLFSWGDLWIYLLANIAASFVAAYTFKYVDSAS
jgi:aquaporin Z